MSTEPRPSAKEAELVRQLSFENGGCDVEDLVAVVEQRMRLEVERLRAIVQDLADPSPCNLDHWGYCQEHYWFATDPPCPHGRAHAMWLAFDGREMSTRGQPSGREAGACGVPPAPAVEEGACGTACQEGADHLLTQLAISASKVRKLHRMVPTGTGFVCSLCCKNKDYGNPCETVRLLDFWREWGNGGQ